jgi:hypothetical protein
MIDRIAARIYRTQARFTGHLAPSDEVIKRSKNMRVTILAALAFSLSIVSASAEPGAGLEGIGGAMRYATSPWLSHAIRDLGTNPTGWKRQWCARSINLWLQRSGKRGCGGNTAISCLHAGRRLGGPQVGALAVMAHHVGIVKEVNGNSVTLVSGNHSGRSGARKVGVGTYARSRVVAYVWPE